MGTIHHFMGTEIRYEWENVKSIYFEDGVTKSLYGRIMIGKDDGANYFVFRYVCVEPGGHSTLDDYHAHDHGVIILHGRALVRLEGKEFELGPMDVLYVEPWEHHSLATIGDQPMGFLCVIPNKDMLKKIEKLEEGK